MALLSFAIQTLSDFPVSPTNLAEHSAQGLAYTMLYASVSPGLS